jgi:hypothetical protein
MPDSAKVIEKEMQPVEESHVVAEEKYRTNKISVEECKRLAEKLEIVMHREKPYTNPNLKIADLAVSIGTSSHTLSYLFNQYLNRNQQAVSVTIDGWKNDSTHNQYNTRLPFYPDKKHQIPKSCRCS